MYVCILRAVTLIGFCFHMLMYMKALLAEKKRMDELDEKEIQLFADAKKKMVQMRKDKEIELFRFVSRRGISFHRCVGGTGVLVVFCIIIQTHPDIHT